MKTYIIKKVACKGVSTKYAWDFIITGMASVMKPIRLKEGLIRTHAAANTDKDAEFLKDIGANIWNNVSKEMHSIYIKRKGDEGITLPQDAGDLPDLIKNAYSEEPISIEKELSENEIQIEKPVHKNYFGNPVIPTGWFDTKRPGTDSRKLFLPEKIQTITQNTATGLDSGQIWFAGDVLQSRKTTTGKLYYIFHLKFFKGKKAPLNFIKKIPAQIFDGFFESEKEILNKYLEIRLTNSYLGNGYPIFEVQISDSNLSTPFESEITEESELTETEKRKLMEYDFGEISCKIKS